MNLKQFSVVAICILFSFSAYSQFDKNGQKPSKFYISLNAGMGFGLVSSNTAIVEDLSLPSSKRGFSPGFDAAWFFSENYGVGIKYGFSTSDYKKKSSIDYKGEDPDTYTRELSTLRFSENYHMIGPALYARWSLGDSKWMILANAGVVMLYDNLFSINRQKTTATAYIIDSDGLGESGPSTVMSEHKWWVDHKGSSVGFALSAAIRYEITPIVGISLQTNGVYASLSEMRRYNNMEKQYENKDISRKIGRIGLSAGIDFSF